MSNWDYLFLSMKWISTFSVFAVSPSMLGNRQIYIEKNVFHLFILFFLQLAAVILAPEHGC